MDIHEIWKKEIYVSEEWEAVVKGYLESEDYESLEYWARDMGYIYDPISDIWFDEYNSTININVEIHDFLDAIGYLD